MINFEISKTKELKFLNVDITPTAYPHGYSCKTNQVGGSHTWEQTLLLTVR